MLCKKAHKRSCFYLSLALVGVLGHAVAAPAEQTVHITAGEHYVLIENGSKRTTDGKGNSRILLDDGRVVRIDSKGVVEVRDANNKRLSHGSFLRWHSLSAGRVEIRQDKTKVGLKNRQGRRAAGARRLERLKSSAITKPRANTSATPKKITSAPRSQRRIDVGAQLLIYH